MADLEDLEEEQMLMKAIAMSLEEEEELCSVKGEHGYINQLVKKKVDIQSNNNLQAFS